MMGCCSMSGRKFINSKGSIDQERLESVCHDLAERLTVKKIPQEVKDSLLTTVRECDCPCHKDGINCLC